MRCANWWLEIVHLSPEDSPGETTQGTPLVGVVAAADQFYVRRGIVPGAAPPEVTESARKQDLVIPQTCPPPKPGEADMLVEMLETYPLCLTQLMEFGDSGLFGVGIPNNPFRK